MSATIFGSGDTEWNGSRGTFFWTLESVARRTDDMALSARLLDLSDAGVNWLDLDEFSPGERSVLVTLLRESVDVAARELPPSTERDDFLAELGEMRSLA